MRLRGARLNLHGGRLGGLCSRDLLFYFTVGHATWPGATGGRHRNEWPGLPRRSLPARPRPARTAAARASARRAARVFIAPSKATHRPPPATPKRAACPVACPAARRQHQRRPADRPQSTPRTPSAERLQVRLTGPCTRTLGGAPACGGAQGTSHTERRNTLGSKTARANSARGALVSGRRAARRNGDTP